MSTEEKNWRKNCYPFNWMCKTLFFFTVFVGFVSCQTLFKKSVIPDNLSFYKSGTFSGLVTVHRKKEKHYFSGDVFISPAGQVRIDLSVSFGLDVFTLLLDHSDITFLFLKTKEFYKSRDIKNVPESFFPKNLDLFSFQRVFFDRKPKGKDWVCTTDKKGLPRECKNPDMIIEWVRKGVREISFKSSDYHFTFRPLFFSPKVDEKLFSIEIPKNFKKVFFLK